MREIKFRLISNGKIVGYEWHSSRAKYVSIMQGRDNETWFNIRMHRLDYIEHDHKDQYTGLKDKDGVEIYEGDVLDIGNPTNAVVLYNEQYIAFGLEDGGVCEFLERCDDIYLTNHSEIIGNIHENPELLGELK